MYVIYLSNNLSPREISNCYGYYAGKFYRKDGGTYPVTDDYISSRTKKYINEKRAIKAAKLIMDKCCYVLSFEIQDLKEQ
jgi:hypothetical protein